jgi:hypothetical protein
MAPKEQPEEQRKRTESLEEIILVEEPPPVKASSSSQTSTPRPAPVSLNHSPMVFRIPWPEREEGREILVISCDISGIDSSELKNVIKNLLHSSIQQNRNIALMVLQGVSQDLVDDIYAQPLPNFWQRSALEGGCAVFCNGKILLLAKDQPAAKNRLHPPLNGQLINLVSRNNQHLVLRILNVNASLVDNPDLLESATIKFLKETKGAKPIVVGNFNFPLITRTTVGCFYSVRSLNNRITYGQARPLPPPSVIESSSDNHYYPVMTIEEKYQAPCIPYPTETLAIFKYEKQLQQTFGDEEIRVYPSKRNSDDNSGITVVMPCAGIIDPNTDITESSDTPSVESTEEEISPAPPDDTSKTPAYEFLTLFSGSFLRLGTIKDKHTGLNQFFTISSSTDEGTVLRLVPATNLALSLRQFTLRLSDKNPEILTNNTLHMIREMIADDRTHEQKLNAITNYENYQQKQLGRRFLFTTKTMETVKRIATHARNLLEMDRLQEEKAKQAESVASSSSKKPAISYDLMSPNYLPMRFTVPWPESGPDAKIELIVWDVSGRESDQVHANLSRCITTYFNVHFIVLLGVGSQQYETHSHLWSIITSKPNCVIFYKNSLFKNTPNNLRTDKKYAPAPHQRINFCSSDREVVSILIVKGSFVENPEGFEFNILNFLYQAKNGGKFLVIGNNFPLITYTAVGCFHSVLSSNELIEYTQALPEPCLEEVFHARQITDLSDNDYYEVMAIKEKYQQHCIHYSTEQGQEVFTIFQYQDSLRKEFRLGEIRVYLSKRKSDNSCRITVAIPCVGIIDPNTDITESSDAPRVEPTENISPAPADKTPAYKLLTSFSGVLQLRIINQFLTISSPIDIDTTLRLLVLVTNLALSLRPLTLETHAGLVDTHQMIEAITNPNNTPEHKQNAITVYKLSQAAASKLSRDSYRINTVERVVIHARTLVNEIERMRLQKEEAKQAESAASSSSKKPTARPDPSPNDLPLFFTIPCSGTTDVERLQFISWDISNQDNLDDVANFLRNAITNTENKGMVLILLQGVPPENSPVLTDDTAWSQPIVSQQGCVAYYNTGMFKQQKARNSRIDQRTVNALNGQLITFSLPNTIPEQIVKILNVNVKALLPVEDPYSHMVTIQNFLLQNSLYTKYIAVGYYGFYIAPLKISAGCFYSNRIAKKPPKCEQAEPIFFNPQSKKSGSPESLNRLFARDGKSNNYYALSEPIINLFIDKEPITLLKYQKFLRRRLNPHIVVNHSNNENGTRMVSIEIPLATPLFHAPSVLRTPETDTEDMTSGITSDDTTDTTEVETLSTPLLLEEYFLTLLIQKKNTNLEIEEEKGVLQISSSDTDQLVEVMRLIELLKTADKIFAPTPFDIGYTKAKETELIETAKNMIGAIINRKPNDFITHRWKNIENILSTSEWKTLKQVVVLMLIGALIAATTFGLGISIVAVALAITALVTKGAAVTFGVMAAEIIAALVESKMSLMLWISMGSAIITSSTVQAIINWSFFKQADRLENRMKIIQNITDTANAFIGERERPPSSSPEIQEGPPTPTM